LLFLFILLFLLESLLYVLDLIHKQITK